MSSGPARSALQLLLQGVNRAAAAVLVMAKAHATLLLLVWRTNAHSPADAGWQSSQIEQRGDGGDSHGTGESKMGKPVRKTMKSGLLPSAISVRPKNGLKVRETTLASGTHTATPDTKTVCESYIGGHLRKCFDKANEV